MAVPVWVVDSGHSGIGSRIVEQCRYLFDKKFGICTDQFHCTGFNGLGTLCDVSRNEHGLAKGGGFLLYSPGIGNNDMCFSHKVHEGDIIERRDQVNILAGSQALMDRISNVWVWMNRIYNVNVIASGNPN